ncbi:hypothetical protein EBAPG3_006005 [Nitrosospira lacus]|uniref:Uncharacterized protein n=1 Tax=Nitrosospira lacus TaxID=1288494 RepID=A0A1W6SNI5_9PROT|nr:hypothetical protein EBAPG3_006005 [Nitrosospira lacus]
MLSLVSSHEKTCNLPQYREPATLNQEINHSCFWVHHLRWVLEMAAGRKLKMSNHQHLQPFPIPFCD